MAQNLGDDVDGHAVFDGQRGERMPGAVCRQVFRDIADPGQFFQVGIHLRVGLHGVGMVKRMQHRNIVT